MSWLSELGKVGPKLLGLDSKKETAVAAPAATDPTTVKLEKTQAENVDIFYAQQQIVDSLESVLGKQQSDTAGTIYVQPQAIAQPANYMLYIGIAAAVLALWYFLRK